MSYLGQRLKPQIMTLHSLNLMAPRKASIAIHHKCDMLGDRSLAYRADEELPELVDAPFDGGRVHGPFAELVEVHGGHGGGKLCL